MSELVTIVTKILLVVLFLAKISHVFLMSPPPSYCYATDKKPYTYFAAKTSYLTVAAKDMIIPQQMSVCQPSYTWKLIRHGPRFRSKEAWSEEKMTALVNAIVENATKGGGYIRYIIYNTVQAYRHSKEIYLNTVVDTWHNNSKLCQEDIDLLRNWTYEHPDETTNLSKQGILDAQELAHRLKNKFPSLLQVEEDKLTFVVTDETRVRTAALAFINALLGTSYEEINESNSITQNNELLRILRSTTYTLPVESQNFLNSKYMQKIIKDVSERLGFLKNELPKESVMELYEFCATESSWNSRSKSPLCATLEPDQLKFFEYLYDMTYFYEYGHVYKEAFDSASPIVEDMVATLRKAAEGELAHKRASFNFAHRGTLMATITRMGLYRDKFNLTTANYENEFVQQRKWKTSIFDPFSANIISVLYKCQDNYKVLLYINENLIELPGCDMGVCSLYKFEELMDKGVPPEKENTDKTNTGTSSFGEPSTKRLKIDEENVEP